MIDYVGIAVVGFILGIGVGFLIDWNAHHRGTDE